MQLQITREGATTRMILDGRLDAKGAKSIQDPFAIGINSGGGTVVLDCAKLTFIASLGMSMLINAAKVLHRNGRDIVLLRPQPLVEESLRMAGMHNIIRILHEEDGAQGPRG